MKADVVSTGAFCQITLPEQELTFTFERLKQHSSGAITGEVTARTTRKGFEPHLFRHSLSNVLGATNKRAMAKDLADRAGFEIAASGDLVEAVTMAAVDRYRRGEPLRQLGASESVPKLSFMLSPLLLETQPTMFFGDGGSAKSVTALFCAMLIQSGTAMAGLTPKQSNVLYLDWETDWESTERRALLLRTGLGLNGNSIMGYRRCTQPLADDIEEIQKMIIQGKFKYVIIDSLSGACGDDLKEQVVAAHFIKALASLNVGSLIITHIPKDENSDGATGKPRRATAFGSAFWKNFVRSQFEARKESAEPGSRAITIGLFHRKANDTALMKPMALTITFDDEAITVERAEFNRMDAFIEGLPIRQRLEAVLRTGAKSIKDLAELTGIKDNTIRINLGRYDGTFARLPDGTWGLKAPVNPQARFADEPPATPQSPPASIPTTPPAWDPNVDSDGAPFPEDPADDADDGV